ncbi:hypothetical protein ACWEQG_01925 [Microbispora sp. NPDC004025]
MPFKDFTIEEARSSDINTYLMNQMVITCTSGTRPSPVNGMRIWQTDTLTGFVYESSAWRLIRAVPLVAVKTVNESVASSTTLQNDDHLLVNVAPGAVYLVQCFVWVSNSGANAGMKASWYGPSGATMTWTTQVPHTSAPDNVSNPISVNAFIAIGDAGDIRIPSVTDSAAVLQGLLQTAGSGGTFGLRWAQSSSNASAVTVKAGSHLFVNAVA